MTALCKAMDQLSRKGAMDVACVELQARWMLHALDQGATQAMDHEKNLRSDSAENNLLIKM